MNSPNELAFIITPLIGAIISLALAALVLVKSKRNYGSQIFCGLLISVALQCFIVSGLRSSPTVDQALLWERAMSVIGPIGFLLYYHFAVVYAGANTNIQKGILFLSYLFLATVAALTPTGLLIEGMYVGKYGYYPILGSFAIVIGIIGILWLVGGVYNLIRRYRVNNSNEEKKRILLILYGIIFPIAGSMSDGFTNLPPLAIWGNVVFCIFCTIAILKYHLLDISIYVRKSLVYLLVSIVVAIPYAGIFLFASHFLGPIASTWWIYAIMLLLLAILLRPLYGWAQNIVDRLFYRNRYNYLRALEQFSKETQSIARSEDLNFMLVELISGVLNSSNACLLAPSDGNFTVVSSIGLNNPPPKIVIRSQSPLAKWLKLNGRILSYSEFNSSPELQRITLSERQSLEKVQADLFVPIKTHEGVLSGVLVLGEKRSQQPYSSIDLRLLFTLSNQMAITLENAQLYNESKREVEERKNAEKALHVSEEKYRTLLEEAPIAICNVDIKGKITYVNKRFEECSGYSREEVLGKNGFKVGMFSPETLKYFAKRMRERLRGKPPQRWETQFKCKDGTWKWIEIEGKLIKEHGVPVGFQIASSDINERKRTEEREKDMQRELILSSRLASIGELAAGVAHEINNPLTGIVGFSERLLRRSANEETIKELEIIHNEAKRAATVVQNLLTFARRREQKKALSNINDVLQQTIELRAYELKTSGIEVETNLAPDLPEILINFQQMQQVFLNIIVNAEQVMSDVNDSRKLHINTEKIKDYVRISITDNGLGIPDEYLDKLFDPFFTTRGEKGGTGLGLSVCHGIVTEHGGRIYAESQSDRNTTFFVELPITSQP